MKIASTTAFQHGGYLTVALVGICILFVTLCISQICVLLFRKVFHRVNEGEKAGSIFTKIIRVVIWAFGLSAILDCCLGIDPSVIWGALGITGIALSLGLQNTISNLLAGLQISFSKDLSIGDWVQVGAVTGKVADIGWRVTKVLDAKGNENIVPNSVLTSATFTRLTEYLRVEIPLALNPAADMKVVEPALIARAWETLQKADMAFSADAQPLVSNVSLDSYGFNIVVICKCKRDFDSLEVMQAVLPELLACLNEQGAFTSSAR